MSIPPLDWRKAYVDYSRQKEDFVIARMTGRVGVDVRKPRWLPAFVWRWMWRHVVLIEERPSFALEYPASWKTDTSGPDPKLNP